VQAVYSHLQDRDDNPVVVIPTGGGKTPVMATICDDAVSKWNGRVLILAHVKELLEQTAGTLIEMAPQLAVGVYSAGLKRRDMGYAVTVAGIQSVYKRACEFEPFDLIIIDECHLIAPAGEGMYRQFLSDAIAVNPHVRTIGLTATPFRMTSGLICRPDHFLNDICYEIGIKELIRDGCLCPLRTKAGIEKIDTSNLHIRAGEFVAGEVEELMDTDHRVKAACAEIVELTQERNSVLIFASGVQHGKHVQGILKDQHGIECGFVCGDTPAGWREKLLRDFREGRLKYLCNVNVLTTGFDAPNIDCIAMLRPTNSPGLYCQMVGRSFRLHPAKQDSLILDFGSNVLRHGPVDDLKVTESDNGSGDAPAKECPQCQELIHAAYGACPECGHEFPPPQRRRHGSKASSEGILSGHPTFTEYTVRDVFYSVHSKRGAPQDAPKSMRVEYEIGWQHTISEWICLEHTGYARRKAQQWWQRRTDEPVPQTAAAAVAIAQQSGLMEPARITVRKITGEKFDRIVGYELPEREAAILAGAFANEQVPF